MARDRSFADYVREKLYNRIYKSVEEFVQTRGRFFVWEIIHKIDKRV